jgi:hypothetical protein
MEKKKHLIGERRLGFEQLGYLSFQFLLSSIEYTF